MQAKWLIKLVNCRIFYFTLNVSTYYLGIMFHIQKKLWSLVMPLLVYFVSPELGPNPVTGGCLLDQGDLHGLIRVLKSRQLESVSVTR